MNMANMGSYCKAYPVERFREYPLWVEKEREKPVEKDQAEAGQSEGEAYYFLQENYTVTDNIFLDEGVVFDSVTPEWQEFCKMKLEFVIPDFSLQEASEGVASVQ
jgi:hypothetical protein